MADKKISELPLLNSVSGSSLVIPIVHDGTTVKLNLSQLGHYASQWSAQTGSANTFTGNQTIVGNLAVSGDITAERYYIETISSSVIYESGSTLFGNSGDDTHTFTGSIILNGATIGAAELNSFTASQLAVNLGISSVTGSINTTTASFDSVFLGISSVTGSINTTTSSFDSVFQRISSTTGSINTTTSSFDSVFLGISSVTGAINTTTSSFDSVFLRISSTTGSINTTTASFDSVFLGISSTTGSINTTTASFDSVFLGISSTTGSINTTTSSFSSEFNKIGSTTASIHFTTGALNAFTGSVIGQTNTISTFTSSVNFTTQSLNTQTGSQDLVNLGISSVTGSINTTTSSFDLVFRGISSVTGAINLTTSSLIGITNGLMAFTAALDNTYATDAQLYQLYQATASIHSATASLNTQTGSQDLVNTGISSVTGSINTTTSSFNSVFLGISSVTGAINLTTASLIGITNGLMAFTAALDSTYATDAQLYQLYQATASIHFTTQSLNTQSGSQDLVNLGISTFTGSLRSEVNLIEAYTASLKAAAIVSSSTQISNYYKFAETASANTFYGTQTINGNLQLSSTSPLVYNAGDTNAMLFGFFDGGTIYGPYYQIFGSNYSNVSQRGSAEFVFDSRNSGFTGFNIAEFNGSTWLRKFRVSPNGAEVTGSFVVDGGITGSLMATNNVVSSSTQIQNYNLFAITSSANSFYGAQSVSGSLFVTSNSGFGTSDATGSGILKVISAGTQNAFSIGQSNSKRWTGFGANDLKVYGDDYFITTVDAFPLSIGTNNISRLTIANDGGINATGAITASNFRISTAGGGIDFSITPNSGSSTTSEILSDYEEGTWTPVIGGSTSESGQSYTHQRGAFVKVGRLVTCTFDVALSTKGTITGAIVLKGLPFMRNTNSNFDYPRGLVGWEGTSTSYVGMQAEVNTLGTAEIKANTAASTNLTSTIAAADLTDSARFFGTITYITF